MEEKTINQVAAIDAAKFQPLQKNTKEEREAIAAPSPTFFFQDSWRRLKKNKAAVFSIVLLLIIIAISIITIFVSPHDPTAQKREVHESASQNSRTQSPRIKWVCNGWW